MGNAEPERAAFNQCRILGQSHGVAVELQWDSLLEQLFQNEISKWVKVKEIIKGNTPLTPLEYAKSNTLQ
ncbi:MAG: hypothetical protein JNM24_04845 [Bdellovibrionaceae bacterium]|nr:hypothetical protein [Pseudobdellovibrionaceae bacterium]